MTEYGTVVKCKDNFVKVRIGRTSACASCGKCGMTESQKHVDFFVENTVGAKENDTVELEIPDVNTAPLAFVAYILPLIPALAMMFLSFALQWKEYWALPMFLGGLAIGFVVVALIDKLRKHKWAQAPVIKAVVNTRPAVTQPEAQSEQKKENEDE